MWCASVILPHSSVSILSQPSFLEYRMMGCQTHVLIVIYIFPINHSLGCTILLFLWTWLLRRGCCHLALLLWWTWCCWSLQHYLQWHHLVWTLTSWWSLSGRQAKTYVWYIIIRYVNKDLANLSKSLFWSLSTV